MLVAALSHNVPKIKGMDYVGIDRGALVCVEEQIPMLCAIGDFDSVTSEERKKIEQAVETQVLPVKKDETDTEQGILYALEHHYDEIYLYGGLGGRMDHEMANLHLMLYRDLPITLMNERNELKVLHTGSYKFQRDKRYLSLLALEETCISEKGVEYPLNQKVIQPSDIYTISNRIIEAEAEIIIHYGKVLFMRCAD